MNNSEFNAWGSAAGLLNLLTNLDAKYPDNVYLIAHGYGAITAGEALRLAGTNQVANAYVAMQGAVPAAAYYPTAPIRALNSTGVSLDSGTPDDYRNYPLTSSSYFWTAGGAGAYINFYNPSDYVLTNLWRADQDKKPDVGYHWDGTNFSKNIFHPYTMLSFPTNAYEIFSYCDEARCDAIGAQSNLGGVFLGYSQTNLALGPFNFGNLEKDHSAQFLDYNAHRWQFWEKVLESMGLK